MYIIVLYLNVPYVLCFQETTNEYYGDFVIMCFVMYLQDIISFVVQ